MQGARNIFKRRSQSLHKNLSCENDDVAKDRRSFDLGWQTGEENFLMNGAICSKTSRSAISIGGSAMEFAQKDHFFNEKKIIHSEVPVHSPSSGRYRSSFLPQLKIHGPKSPILCPETSTVKEITTSSCSEYDYLEEDGNSFLPLSTVKPSFKLNLSKAILTRQSDASNNSAQRSWSRESKPFYNPDLLLNDCSGSFAYRSNDKKSDYKAILRSLAQPVLDYSLANLDNDKGDIDSNLKENAALCNENILKLPPQTEKLNKNEACTTPMTEELSRESISSNFVPNTNKPLLQDSYYKCKEQSLKSVPSQKTSSLSQAVGRLIKESVEHIAALPNPLRLFDSAASGASTPFHSSHLYDSPQHHSKVRLLRSFSGDDSTRDSDGKASFYPNNQTFSRASQSTTASESHDNNNKTCCDSQDKFQKGNAVFNNQKISNNELFYRHTPDMNMHKRILSDSSNPRKPSNSLPPLKRFSNNTSLYANYNSTDGTEASNDKNSTNRFSKRQASLPVRPPQQDKKKTLSSSPSPLLEEIVDRASELATSVGSWLADSLLKPPSDSSDLNENNAYTQQKNLRRSNDCSRANAYHLSHSKSLPLPYTSREIYSNTFPKKNYYYPDLQQETFQQEPTLPLYNNRLPAERCSYSRLSSQSMYGTKRNSLSPQPRQFYEDSTLALSATDHPRPSLSVPLESFNSSAAIWSRQSSVNNFAIRSNQDALPPRCPLPPPCSPRTNQLKTETNILRKNFQKGFWMEKEIKPVKDRLPPSTLWQSFFHVIDPRTKIELEQRHHDKVTRAGHSIITRQKWNCTREDYSKYFWKYATRSHIELSLLSVENVPYIGQIVIETASIRTAMPFNCRFLRLPYVDEHQVITIWLNSPVGRSQRSTNDPIIGSDEHQNTWVGGINDDGEEHSKDITDPSNADEDELSEEELQKLVDEQIHPKSTTYRTALPGLYTPNKDFVTYFKFEIPSKALLAEGGTVEDRALLDPKGCFYECNSERTAQKNFDELCKWACNSSREPLIKFKAALQLQGPKVLVCTTMATSTPYRHIESTSFYKNQYLKNFNNNQRITVLEEKLVYVGLSNDPLDQLVAQELNRDSQKLLNIVGLHAIQRLHYGRYLMNGIEVDVSEEIICPKNFMDFNFTWYPEITGLDYAQGKFRLPVVHCEGICQPVSEFLRRSRTNQRFLAYERHDQDIGMIDFSFIPSNTIPQLMLAPSQINLPYEAQKYPEIINRLYRHARAIRANLALMYYPLSKKKNAPMLPKTIVADLVPPHIRLLPHSSKVPVTFSWDMSDPSKVAIVPLETDSKEIYYLIPNGQLPYELFQNNDCVEDENSSYLDNDCISNSLGSADGTTGAELLSNSNVLIFENENLQQKQCKNTIYKKSKSDSNHRNKFIPTTLNSQHSNSNCSYYDYTTASNYLDQKQYNQCQFKNKETDDRTTIYCSCQSFENDDGSSNNNRKNNNNNNNTSSRLSPIQPLLEDNNYKPINNNDSLNIHRNSTSATATSLSSCPSEKTQSLNILLSPKVQCSNQKDKHKYQYKLLENCKTKLPSKETSLTFPSSTTPIQLPPLQIDKMIAYSNFKQNLSEKLIQKQKNDYETVSLKDHNTNHSNEVLEKKWHNDANNNSTPNFLFLNEENNDSSRSSISSNFSTVRDAPLAFILDEKESIRWKGKPKEWSEIKTPEERLKFRKRLLKEQKINKMAKSRFTGQPLGYRFSYVSSLGEVVIPPDPPLPSIESLEVMNREQRRRLKHLRSKTVAQSVLEHHQKEWYVSPTYEKIVKTLVEYNLQRVES